MSAVKDPNQKTTFIYSNFYHIYRKGRLTSGAPSAELTKGVVLNPEPVSVRVVSQEEQEGIQSWVSGEVQNGKKALADRLHSLRDASKRLKFLMTEVDEILKKG